MILKVRIVGAILRVVGYWKGAQREHLLYVRRNMRKTKTKNETKTCGIEWGSEEFWPRPWLGCSIKRADQLHPVDKCGNAHQFLGRLAFPGIIMCQPFGGLGYRFGAQK